MTSDPHLEPTEDDRPGDRSATPPGRDATPGRSRTTQWLAAAAVTGVLLGTTGIAVAQTSDSSTSDPGTSTEQTAPTGAPPDQVDRSQAVHPGEELLTGDTAAQVAAAAQAAVPDATVDRVETDAEGSPYEAHMTKSDGTHLTVKVDERYTVTDVEEDQGPPAGSAPRGAPATGSASSAASAGAAT